MSIPATLEADPDFMFLYRAQLLGSTDADRRAIDNLISFAHVRGKSEGVGEAVEILRKTEKTS